MSGAETIAGLVLGGFPLLISAVESYEECFRVLGCWINFRQEYRKCCNRLKQLDVEYDLTLDKVFLDLVDSHEEMEQLKMQPEKDDWANLEAKVRQRLLPKVRQCYIDTIEEIRDTMEELHEELGFRKGLFQQRLRTKNREFPKQNSNLRNKVRSRASYEAQRTKFGLSRERREDLFSQMDRLNGTLRRLLVSNDEVTRIIHEKSLRPGTAAQGQLLHFWMHACKIFGLLSKAWGCPCRTKHRADLLLVYRTTADVQLDLLFHFERPAVTSTSPWMYHQARVTRALNSVPITVTDDRVITPTQVDKRQLEPVSMPVSGRLKKKAASLIATSSYASPVRSTSQSHQGSGSSTTVQSMTVRPKHASLPSLDRLCQEISDCGLSNPYSAKLVDDEPGEDYIITSKVPVPINLDRDIGETNFLTLNDLLTHNPPSRRDRYRLALVIASSHVQLHSTAFLGSRWSSTQIAFPAEGQKPSLSQPFLRNPQPFSPTVSIVGTSDADETFATLGILLLELCFGTTLENSPFRQKYRSPTGQPDIVMDYAAASQWADRVGGESGPEYAQAVDWCLERWRMKPRGKLWKQEFQVAVIEPLRIALEKMTTALV